MERNTIGNILIREIRLSVSTSPAPSACSDSAPSPGRNGRGRRACGGRHGSLDINCGKEKCVQSRVLQFFCFFFTWIKHFVARVYGYSVDLYGAAALGSHQDLSCHNLEYIFKMKIDFTVGNRLSYLSKKCQQRRPVSFRAKTIGAAHERLKNKNISIIRQFFSNFVSIYLYLAQFPRTRPVLPGQHVNSIGVGGRGLASQTTVCK